MFEIIPVAVRTRQVEELIDSDEHPRADTSVESLSKLKPVLLAQDPDLGVSGPHGAKLFKWHTGVGIREYAKTRRLLVAAEKLKGTSQSVKEIAADLGYRNPTDLRRQFRQFFQLSPNDFRTVYRQNTEYSCIAV